MSKKGIKQITICFPEELLDALKEEAEKKGYTVTDLIIFILQNFCF